MVTPEFSRSNFFEMRRNPKCYKVFFDRFAPIVERKLSWNGKMVKAQSDKDMLSISSEAFGLLLIENMWDRWIDIYRLTNGDVALHRRATSMKKINSKVLPLYTCGGVHIDKDGDSEDSGGGRAPSSTMKGWTASGIKRFNELYDVVAYDRKAHPEFFRDWIRTSRKDHDKSETRGEYKKKRNDALGKWNLEDNEEDGLRNDQNLQKAQKLIKRVEVEKARDGRETDDESDDGLPEVEADEEGQEDDEEEQGQDDDDEDDAKDEEESDDSEDDEDQDKVTKRSGRHENISDNKETTEPKVPRRVNKKPKSRKNTDELLVAKATRTSPRKTTRSVKRRRR